MDLIIPVIAVILCILIGVLFLSYGIRQNKSVIERAKKLILQ